MEGHNKLGLEFGFSTHPDAVFSTQQSIFDSELGVRRGVCGKLL